MGDAFTFGNGENDRRTSNPGCLSDASNRTLQCHCRQSREERVQDGGLLGRQLTKAYVQVKTKGINADKVG
jgi:hypothetical protein